MRNSLLYFLAFVSVSVISKPLFSDVHDGGFDFSDFSAETVDAASTDSPFSLTVEADFIGKSKIKNTFYEGDKLEFRTGEIEGSAVFYYNSTYKEGLAAILNYNPTWIGWKENPWFSQEHFNVVSLGLGGFTERLNRWQLRGEFEILTDAEEFPRGFSYVFYNLLAWGRYKVCHNIGLHFGLIAEIGMRTDRVYPILGFDWKIRPNLNLNAVFPVNVSLDYTFLKYWKVALAGRFFSFRDRAKKSESSSGAIVRYDNFGIEFSIAYVRENSEVNIHAGSTIGGRLRIANAKNHHPRRYKLEGAPYVGGGATFRF